MKTRQSLAKKGTFQKIYYSFLTHLPLDSHEAFPMEGDLSHMPLCNALKKMKTWGFLVFSRGIKKVLIPLFVVLQVTWKTFVLLTFLQYWDLGNYLYVAEWQNFYTAIIFSIMIYIFII